MRGMFIMGAVFMLGGLLVLWRRREGDRVSTTVVGRFHYRHEAELARGYLESAGVDSALHIDDAGGMDVGLAFVNPARLVVRAEDETRAREVLVDAGLLEAPETP